MSFGKILTKRSIDTATDEPIVEAFTPFGHAQYKIDPKDCKLYSRVKGHTAWEHDEGMASLVTMLVDLAQRHGCYGAKGKGGPIATATT